MKRIKMVLAICLFLFAYPVFANEPVTVTVNGRIVEFDQPPVIEDGRTLVPIRAVAEMFGATVEWDSKAKTTRISYGEVTVALTVGGGTMTVCDFSESNENEVELDVPPRIVNGRILLPIRAVIEVFGLDIEWDGSSKNININTLRQTTEFGPNTKRVTYSYVYNGNGSLDYWVQFEYDVNGTLIKGVAYNADRTLKYISEHDAKGYNIKNTWYGTDGSVQSCDTNEFNENGNILTAIHYNGDGSAVNRWEYGYDGNGYITEITLFGANGSVECYSQYENDESGNVIKITTYNGDGTLLEIQICD